MAIRMLSKNKYLVIVEAGCDEFGVRKRKSKTVFGTENDAKIVEGEMLSKIKKGEHLEKNKDITIKELSDKFIELHCKRHIRMVTAKGYMDDIVNINKIIGSLKVSKITPLILEKMYAKLSTGKSGKELGYHSMYSYYKVINVMFNKAIDWGYLETNPNHKVKRPKKPKGHYIDESLNKPYNPEQVRRLLEVLKNERIEVQAVIALGLDGGLRASEVAGLLWENIDFEKNIIRVESSLKYINNKVYRTRFEAKTDDSLRTIEVTTSTMNLLKEVRENQIAMKNKLGKNWINDGDYVFRGKNGRFMSPDRPNVMLRKVIKKYNLEHITYHGLRHTCASVLIQNGIDPKTVSQRLGHSDTTITMEIYNNVFNETTSLCVKKFEELFKN